MKPNKENTNLSQKALITSLKEKEPQAYNQLYDLFAPAFYGEIRRNLYQQEVSNQTLISSFTAISNSMDDYSPTEEKLFIWCLKIVRKEIRKKKVDLILKEIFACQQVPLKKMAATKSQFLNIS